MSSWVLIKLIISMSLGASTGFEHLTPAQKDFIDQHLILRHKIIAELNIPFRDTRTKVALLFDLKNYNLDQLSTISAAPGTYYPRNKVRQLSANFRLPSQQC